MSSAKSTAAGPLRRCLRHIVTTAALLFFSASSWSEGGASLPIMTLSQSPNSASFAASLTPFPVRADDALAYPAYAGYVDRKSLSLGHTLMYQGSSYDTMGFAYPTQERGTVAVGLARLGSGAADGRDVNQNPTGSFTDQQTLLRVAYGDHVFSQLTWGLNLDYYDHSFAGDSIRSVGVGTGVHYKKNAFSAGFAGDNLISNTSGSTDDSLPAQFRLNAAYTLFDRLMLGLDAVVSPRMDLRAGIEYFLFDCFSVRLGHGAGGVGAGIGVKVRDYVLDYNLTVHELGMAQQFRIAAFFGPSHAAQRAERAEDLYREARRLSLDGRYAEASKVMERSGRYLAMPPNRRTFSDSLRRLIAVGVRELGSNEPQASLRKGVGYYLEQKPDLARVMFQKVQAQDGGNEMVAQLLTLVSRPENLPSPPSFVDVDPIRLKLFKIDEYFQKQQWDLALKECREIIALDPSSVIGYVRLGSIYYALGIRNEAAKAWQYAAKLNPNDPDVRKAVHFMQEENLKAPEGAAEYPQSSRRGEK